MRYIVATPVAILTTNNFDHAWEMMLDCLAHVDRGPLDWYEACGIIDTWYGR